MLLEFRRAGSVVGTKRRSQRYCYLPLTRVSSRNRASGLGHGPGQPSPPAASAGPSGAARSGGGPREPHGPMSFALSSPLRDGFGLDWRPMPPWLAWKELNTSSTSFPTSTSRVQRRATVKDIGPCGSLGPPPERAAPEGPAEAAGGLGWSGPWPCPDALEGGSTPELAVVSVTLETTFRPNDTLCSANLEQHRA